MSRNFYQKVRKISVGDYLPATCSFGNIWTWKVLLYWQKSFTSTKQTIQVWHQTRVHYFGLNAKLSSKPLPPWSVIKVFENAVTLLLDQGHPLESHWSNSVFVFACRYILKCSNFCNQGDLYGNSCKINIKLHFRPSNMLCSQVM